MVKIDLTAEIDNKSKTLQHSFHTFALPYLFIHSSEIKKIFLVSIKSFQFF